MGNFPNATVDIFGPKFQSPGGDAAASQRARGNQFGRSCVPWFLLLTIWQSNMAWNFLIYIRCSTDFWREAVFFCHQKKDSLTAVPHLGRTREIVMDSPDPGRSIWDAD